MLFRLAVGDFVLPLWDFWSKSAVRRFSVGDDFVECICIDRTAISEPDDE